MFIKVISSSILILSVLATGFHQFYTSISFYIEVILYLVVWQTVLVVLTLWWLKIIRTNYIRLTNI